MYLNKMVNQTSLGKKRKSKQQTIGFYEKFKNRVFLKPKDKLQKKVREKKEVDIYEHVRHIPRRALSYYEVVESLKESEKEFMINQLVCEVIEIK